MTNLRSLFSLFLSTALLLTGHGVQMTLLPLRADSLGFTSDEIGLSASCYFLGFILGAMTVPKIIARVGHIRSFSALLATFLCTLLIVSLSDALWLWLLGRLVLGASMCGTYTVIESWLADQTDRAMYGRVLSLYTAIVLLSMTGGQVLLQNTGFTTALPFTLAAILAGLAIVPVSLTRTLAPAPIPATRFSFRFLLRRSSTAFVGALGSGVITGSFWSLGAVFAITVTGDASFVPQFIAVSILAGAVAQYPIGFASDLIDRRLVLTALSALVAAAALGMSQSVAPRNLLLWSALFGAGANALYALSLAKAADNTSRDEFVTVASSVLMLNAMGAALAPIGIGWAMRALGPEALFYAIAVTAALCGVFTLSHAIWGTKRTAEDQTQFVATTSAQAPAAFAQDPRASEQVEVEVLAENAESANVPE